MLVNFDAQICALDLQQTVLMVLTFEAMKRQRVQNKGHYYKRGLQSVMREDQAS